MESNNIENQIKQKLDSRTIQPSAQAWDRLDAMLSVAEEKQSKRSYNWLYIAASILGFILVGTVFLSQTEELIDIPKNEIVIENNTIENLQQNQAKEKPAEIKMPINKGVIVIPGTKKSNDVQKQQATPASNTAVAVKDVSPKENTVIEEKALAITPVLKKETKPENSKIKVDASSLLSQVDGELELSFREKVIKKADKNFQSIKVALATRNKNE